MEHSVPYTPQKNGVAERKNRSLKEMETCLLHAKHLPPSLWVEVVNYTSYLQNRVPHKSVVGVTLFKAMHGYKTNVSHLRVFGSKDWARIPLDKRKAFQARSSKCILLGYAEDTKYYKLMEVSTRRCFIERSVHFEEHQMHDNPPATQEGITISPPIFDDDDDVLQVSDSYEEDHIQHDPIIEIESQEILDPDLVPIPNQSPKPRWDQKLLDAAASGVGILEDRRRTRSQYQNEHAALSLTNSLSIVWCSKVPGRCYLMMANDQLHGPEKQKLDHFLPLPSRRDKQSHQFRSTLRGPLMDHATT